MSDQHFWDGCRLVRDQELVAHATIAGANAAARSCVQLARFLLLDSPKIQLAWRCVFATALAATEYAVIRRSDCAPIAGPSMPIVRLAFHAVKALRVAPPAPTRG